MTGVAAVAPPLSGRVLFDQEWTDLVFLHWPVPPEAVAGFLPAGVRPDVLDGVTYVGLIPFHMRRAGPGRGHAVPWLGDFLETNVRLYGVDDEGRHGVVFRSLESSRLLSGTATSGPGRAAGDGPTAGCAPGLRCASAPLSRSRPSSTSG